MSPQDFGKHSSCQPAHTPPSSAGCVTCTQNCGNLWNQSCNHMNGMVSTLAVLQQGEQDGALIVWPVLVKPVVLLALLPLFLLSWVFCYFLHSSNSYPLLAWLGLPIFLLFPALLLMSFITNTERETNLSFIFVPVYIVVHPLKCILSMKFNLAAAAVLIA